MTDIRTLSWPALLAEYKSGTLRKASIVQELRASADDGVPPPPEALAMIADVLAGEGKPLDNARRPRFGGLMARTAAEMSYDLELWIAAGPDHFPDEISADNMDFLRQLHKRTQYDRRSDAATANQLAVSLVADMYGVSEKTVRDWRRKHK